MSNFNISVERAESRLHIALSGTFDEDCSSMVKELLRKNRVGIHAVSIDINRLTNWNKGELLEPHVREWEKVLTVVYEN